MLAEDDRIIYPLSIEVRLIMIGAHLQPASCPALRIQVAQESCRFGPIVPKTPGLGTHGHDGHGHDGHGHGEEVLLGPGSKKDCS